MIQQVETIKNYHVVISGFLQTEGKPNGMIRLWRDLHRAQSGPDTLVLLRTWNDAMDTLAEFIWRLAADDVSVKIYGYSWGGAAAMRLAKGLQKRGIGVREMVLSDAVYRHGYWLGNWRALVPFSTLRVPANVECVRWLRQQGGFWKISGHTIVADCPRKTAVLNPILVTCSHTYMDDLPSFHRIAGNVAANCASINCVTPYEREFLL